MRSPFLTGLLFIAVASALPTWARAEDVYEIVVRKQEQKRQWRWNISEWLETRDKIRLMDLWLALHSPSPYEFFVRGDYQTGNTAVASFTGMGFGGAAYASIFGLEGQYENTEGSRMHGIFHLRVFGFQDQGTNITLEAGLRQQESARNPFWGAHVAICMNRFFGMEGGVRRYYPSTPGPSGVLAGGNRYEGGIFVDFNFVRVYGTAFTEPSNSPSGDRNGVNVGGKIYF